MEEGEEVSWSEVIKIPGTVDSILSIFFQLMAYFWMAEMDPAFYTTHHFPTQVQDVRLRTDHRLVQTKRYHLFVIKEQDTAGVMDPSYYWIQYGSFRSSGSFLEHGEFRHEYQLFLRSFLKTIHPYRTIYPSIKMIEKVIMKTQILKWKCPVCEQFKAWWRDYLDRFQTDTGISVTPEMILCVLSYSHRDLKGMGHVPQEREKAGDAKILRDHVDILEETLTRFWTEFNKIRVQSSSDPVMILRPLMKVLDKYMSRYTLDQISEFEKECSMDMKSVLFSQLKYVKTQSIQIRRFPRELAIIREVFRTIVRLWKCRPVAPPRYSSPGMILLMSYLFFEDSIDPAQEMLLVQYQDQWVLQPKNPHYMMRHLTPPEMELLMDYHPLLRPNLFETQ